MKPQRTRNYTTTNLKVEDHEYLQRMALEYNCSIMSILHEIIDADREHEKFLKKMDAHYKEHLAQFPLGKEIWNNE